MIPLYTIYEMEFQLKLNKAKLDMQELSMEQLEFRREQDKERIRNAQEKLIKERRALAVEKTNAQIESFWTRINEYNSQPKRLKRDLKAFIYLFDSSVSREHPLLAEAKQRLKTLI